MSLSSKNRQAPESRVVLHSAEPQLFVSDIDASCAFFATLGFSVAFVYGKPPFFGQVFRDAARLNLRCVDRPVIDIAQQEREQLLSAVVTLSDYDDVDRLFAEFQSAGVHFFQNVRKEPWGARTFIVQDPDGNLLLFAGPDS